jgi:hypothetical protein
MNQTLFKRVQSHSTFTHSTKPETSRRNPGVVDTSRDNEQKKTNNLGSVLDNMTLINSRFDVSQGRKLHPTDYLPLGSTGEHLGSVKTTTYQGIRTNPFEMQKFSAQTVEKKKQ